jgi:hydroxymethylpyrimidine pyrophosphatase-like HAD family hydrolase
MINKNLSIFQKLPRDAIILCLSYTGKIVYRNGKYINKINISDPRYNMLLNISKPKNYYFNEYTYTYAINLNLKEWMLFFTINPINNVYKYRFYNKTHKYSKYYILDSNNIWRRKVLYLI